MQVKITEPLDEMANALEATLRIVGGLAHMEDVAAGSVNGVRFRQFLGAVSIVAAELKDRPNTNLAIALLTGIRDYTDPKKAMPALKLVK